MRVQGIAVAVTDVCSSTARGIAGASGTPATPLARRSKRRNLQFSVLTALLLLGLGVVEPRAQTQSIEADVARKLQAKPTVGIVTFKLTLWDLETNKEDFCANRIAHFVGSDGQTRKTSTYIGRVGQPPLLHVSVALMEPGTHVLEAISCDTTQTMFKGQFATFTIKTGEVISGGHLIVQFKKDPSWLFNKFSSRQQVKEFDPATLASLKQQLPVTFAKAIKRNLNPINRNPGT